MGAIRDLKNEVTYLTLYVACGISAMIPRCAGMEKAELAVAINHNPKASIFKGTDFGIVGNVRKVNLLRPDRSGFSLAVFARARAE